MDRYTFSKALNRGLIPKLPNGYGSQVFDEFTEGQNIIFQQENEGNFLVATIDKEEKELYSFLRFFTIGDTTHCSIDFQASSKEEMIFKITELLAKKYTF